jgi:hypothetical protein
LADADTITPLIQELEQLCSQAEQELVALRWGHLVMTLADQRRLLAALTNEVHATVGIRSPKYNAQLRHRVARIYAVRDNQLKRLVSFRDNVRNRLTTIAKVKQMRRTFGAYKPPAGRGHLDALR